MSLAAAAHAHPPRECGNNGPSSSVLGKLTAESMYETQQPAHTGSDDGPTAGDAAWLQEQRLHTKIQGGDCLAGAVLVGRSKEREDDARKGGQKEMLQQQPVPAEDAHLQRLLASEGLMRCETLNLFRAQLQQLSRRKDGLMPRADGSFPENWLLLAWEYQGLAEEVMSCQRWPGKYPEGLLRCVTHQVLYLKRRLEAFPSMSGAERDQFRRLYVLAALGIIAKLKLVTFCWTFVELKRGEEIAEQVTEAGRCQQSWQLQVSGSNMEASVNIRATQPGSASSTSGHEPAAGAALPSDTVPLVESVPARGKRKAVSQQVPHDLQGSAFDTTRAFRRKEDRQRVREEHQHQQEVRSQEQERSSVTPSVQQAEEGPQREARHHNEGKQSGIQQEKLPAEEQTKYGQECSSKESIYVPLSLASGVAAEAEWERSGKSEERTVAASEEETGSAQEVSSTCSLPSRRADDLKDQPAARVSEGKPDVAEDSKQAEAKQREQPDGLDPEVQEEEKAEAPEKTEYTTRAGRRTHHVKADAS